MKNSFRVLWALALAWCCAFAALAQPAEGYYRIASVKYSGRVMAEDFVNGGQVKCVSFSEADTKVHYNQLWELQAIDGGYALRNVQTGHYLQPQGSQSSRFVTGGTPAAVTFSAASTEGAWLMNSGGYLHCDGAYDVVNWWDTANDGDHWTFTEVELDETVADAVRAEFRNIETLQADGEAGDNARAGLMARLRQCFAFEGDVCEDPSASYDDCVAAGLPQAICDYVKAWHEASGDDRSYLDRFHRRGYKPYSNPDPWRGKLGTTCLTPMSNPTGVYSDEGDVLYVVVGQDVPDGATLYLGGVNGNGILGNTDGVALRKGVNAVLTPADGTQWYVLYLANTLDENGGMRLLSEFPALDIHIMGGSVNGFLEIDPAKSEDEVNADYAGLIARAADDLNFVVKGEYSLFNFPKATYDAIWSADTSYGAKIYKSIRWYDNVARWSWEIMGLCDAVKAGARYEESWEASIAAHKEDYNVRQSFEGYWPSRCNNPVMAIQVADGVNPHSTGSYTAYPGVSGVESSFNAEREDFDNWCTAHECGHNNQGSINLPSCKESSNNFFSDIVVYQYGYRGGRGGTVAEVNADYQKGLNFALRDIGSTHRMWYQLYLYYHVARKKPDFYPELFRLLREDPIRLANGQTGKDCFLHFYKKACDAAGEDLTDFFRVWGFFFPLDNVYFGDYTSYTISMTQEEIDAAIAGVKAKYPAGDTSASILLIEDRVKNLPRWDAHAADGEMRRDHWGNEFTAGTYGDHGDFSDFAAGAADPSYTYTAEGNTVRVSGSGGLGFVVRDAGGNIIAVSNKNEFTIPLSAVAEGFTVSSVSASGEVAAADLLDSDDYEAQAATLRNLLARADELLAVSSADGMQAGFYRRASLTALVDLAAEASAALEAGTTADYARLVRDLNREYAAAVLADDRVPFTPGAVYALRSQGADNYGTNNLWMKLESDVNVKGGEFSASDLSTHWAVVPAEGRPGRYFIRNLSTSKYISYSAQSAQVKAEAADTATAISYAVYEDGTGKFLLQGDTRATGYKYLHLDSGRKVVGWAGEGSPASHWYLTQIGLDETGASLSRARNLTAAARALIGAVAEGGLSARPAEQPVLLQTTDASGRFYLSGGMTDSDDGKSEIGHLIDGDAGSHYHTNWHSATTEDHWLTVDVGDSDLKLFRLSYTTRDHQNHEHPKTLTVAGSADGTAWTELAVLRHSDANPLPDARGASYTSDLIFNPEGFRYLRFTVNETFSNRDAAGCGHPYFALAEFGLTDAGADLRAFELRQPLYASLDRNLLADAGLRVRQVEAASSAGLDAACAALEAAYADLLAAAHLPALEYGVADVGQPVTPALEPWKIYALRRGTDGPGLRFGDAALEADATTRTGLTPEALSQVFRFEPADFARETYRIYNPAAGQYLAPLSAAGDAVAYAADAAAAGEFRAGLVLNGYCYLQDAASGLLLGGDGTAAPVAQQIAIPGSRADAGVYRLCEIAKGSDYTYVYTVDGQEAETRETVCQKWGEAPVHPQPGFAFATVTLPDDAEPVLGAKTLNIRVEEHLPFRKSASASDSQADWHSVEMHWTDSYMDGKRYAWTYRADNADYNLQMPKIGVSHYKALMDERRQWCFVGNVVDGFRIYNRAAGAGYTVRKPLAGDNLVSLSTDDDHNRFRLYVSDLGVDTAVCFRLPGDTHYLNSRTNSGTDRIIRGWTAADGGSSCRFVRVDALLQARVNVALDSAGVVRAEWAAPSVRHLGYADPAALDEVDAAGMALSGNRTLEGVTAYENAVEACTRRVTLPQAGRQYMIISANTSTNRKVPESAMTIAAGDTSPAWAALDRDASGQRWHLLPSADGSTYRIEPVDRAGQYVAVGSAQSDRASLSAEGTAFVLDPLAPGQFALRESSGRIALHEQHWGDDGYSSGPLINWNASSMIGSPSSWRIEEVGHEVSIGATGYATLWLPYATAVPEGVTASAAILRDDQTGARLRNVGDRLAAETGAVLKGAQGKYAFLYTEDEPAAPEGNCLTGWNRDEHVESATHCYYALRKSTLQGVGFYEPAAFEANGVIWSFTAGARKAYLKVPREMSSSKFFGFVPDTVTGLDEIQADSAGRPVYDLGGRRVGRPGRGLYIVGGKKLITK